MSNIEKMILAIFAVAVSLVLLIVNISLCFFLPVDMAVFLMMLSSIVFVLSVIFALVLDYGSSIYECQVCGYEFKPTVSAYIWSVHTLKKRYLICPKCGKHGFCSKHMQ